MLPKLIIQMQQGTGIIKKIVVILAQWQADFVVVVFVFQHLVAKVGAGMDLQWMESKACWFRAPVVALKVRGESTRWKAE